MQPLKTTADASTGKSPNVMQARRSSIHAPQRARRASEQRRSTIDLFQHFGNAWEASGKAYAIRTPSVRTHTHTPQRKTMQGAKAVKRIERPAQESPELNPADATGFRALAARANYLAQDKPDCAFVAKELCKEFAVPTISPLTD